MNSATIQKFVVQKLKTCTHNTVNVYLKAIKLYGHFTQNEELKHLKLLKKNCTSKATFSVDELKAFLHVSCHSNREGCDYSLFFALVALTSMRLGEVASLTSDCFSFSEGLIYLSKTKTNQPRRVPIPPPLTKSLQKLCNKRGRLFLTNAQEWGSAFHSRLKILGINRRNLTPYSLRHTAITLLLQEPNVTLFDAMKLAGHTNPNTTLVYYHPEEKKLASMVAHHPAIAQYCTITDEARYVCDTIRSLGKYEPNLVPINNGVRITLDIRGAPPIVGAPAAAKH